MGLLSRFVARVRSVIDRFTVPQELPPEPDDREVTRGGRGVRGDDFEDRGASRLPDGWVIAGLYHEGEKTTRISATGDTEATDSDIQEADAIIVHYVDAGGDGYRWIHGATGWDSLSDQIEQVIVIVSPTGRGE